MGARGLLTIMAEVSFADETLDAAHAKCECGLSTPAGTPLYFALPVRRHGDTALRVFASFCSACFGPRYQDRIIAVAKLPAAERSAAHRILSDDLARATLRRMSPDERRDRADMCAELGVDPGAYATHTLEIA